MDTIFTLGDSSDTDNKINLDDLYEKKNNMILTLYRHTIEFLIAYTQK